VEEIPDLISMNQLTEPTDRALAAGRRLYELMRSRYARDTADISRFAGTTAKAKRPNTRRTADFVEAVPPPRPRGVAPARPANRTGVHGTGHAAGTGPYGDFDAKRAKAVDLVELPVVIEGTSCSNCEYFTPTGDALFVTGSDGYCDHPRVRMHVAGSWCCNEWSRDDAPLASPATVPTAKFRRSRGDEDGRRRDDASRYVRTDVRSHVREGSYIHAGDKDDCGHEEAGTPVGGNFTTGNSCMTYRQRKQHAHETRHLRLPEGAPKDPQLRKKLASEKRRGLHEQWESGRESGRESRRHPRNLESREKRLGRLPGGKDPELRKRLGEYREQRSGERREDLERQRAKRRAKESGKSASREAKLLQRLAGGRKGKQSRHEPEEDYDTRRVREQEAQRQAAEAERAKAKAEREARKGPYGRSRHRSSRHSSRYAKAGDADDCGHRTITGHFDFGNTCQSQGRRATLAEPAGRRATPPALGGEGESRGEPAGPSLRPGSQAAKKQPLGKPQWVKSGGRWVPMGRGPKVSREDEEWHAQQLREQEGGQGRSAGRESGKSTSRPMEPSVREESIQKPLKKNGHRQSLGQDIRGSRERGELYNRDPGFDRKLRKRLARVEDLMGKMPKTGTWGNKEWMKLASERREIIDTLKHARNGGGQSRGHGGGGGGNPAGVEEPHPSGFSQEYRRELVTRAMARLKADRLNLPKRRKEALEDLRE
jgi:hypothetical protein